MSSLSPKKFSLLILPVFLLSACGGGHDGASQVVAKVNKSEISVHQINNVLARTPNLTPDQAKVVGKQVLEKLIDQEILVQQAVDKKIDRDPKVMQAIEAAKRDILSRAYLEQLTSALSKPSASEIGDFYTKHPELFSDRRIFTLNEISIRGSDDLLPRLKEHLTKAKSLGDIADWLKAEKIPYTVSNGTKPAEQLPLEYLPRFQKMREGEIGVIPTKEAVMLVQLVATKSAPIEEKSATPIIEQFLLNQRRMETINKEMKELREKATIEYVGDFAKAKEDKPAAAAPTAAGLPVATTPAASTPATPDAAAPAAPAAKP